MKSFGYYLNKVRKEKGLKQKELAAIMGFSSAMISQYELDKRKPKPETIEKFKNALGCSWEDLGYKETYWDILPEADPDPVPSDPKEEILKAIELLNDDGRKKVLDYIHDILNNPKYKIPSL